MPLSKKDKLLILELKEILQNKYAQLIERIYCHGSRVTKKEQDADFDVLIITGKPITWETEYKIIETIVNLGIKNDIVFDVQVTDFQKFSLSKKFDPFFHDVAKYGILV